MGYLYRVKKEQGVKGGLIDLENPVENVTKQTSVSIQNMHDPLPEGWRYLYRDEKVDFSDREPVKQLDGTNLYSSPWYKTKKLDEPKVPVEKQLIHRFPLHITKAFDDQVQIFLRNHPNLKTSEALYKLILRGADNEGVMFDVPEELDGAVEFTYSIRVNKEDKDRFDSFRNKGESTLSLTRRLVYTGLIFSK